jgi:phosphoserine phosphatase
METDQESLLLFAMRETLTDSQQGRYAELVAKRRSATLTEAEYTELLELSGLVEAMDARRLELLSRLAALRQVPLTQLISELNLPQHTV